MRRRSIALVLSLQASADLSLVQPNPDGAPSMPKRTQVRYPPQPSRQSLHTSYKWLTTTISTIPLWLEKGRGTWAAAENFGSLLTGRPDGDHKTLKQQQRDDASHDGKHGNDKLGSPVCCPFAVKGMAAFRGTEHSVVIIHRHQWPEFQVSQRHGAARERLVGASRKYNPHPVASPTGSCGECTAPT